MINKKFNYREANKFDVWYCKDRRILIYLGKASNNSPMEGQHVWVWIGTMMAVEQGYRNSIGNYAYYPIDEKYIKQNLVNHIQYLFGNINFDSPAVIDKGYKKVTILDELILNYKGAPNVTAYMGNFRHPLLDTIEQRYTLPELVEPKVERAELKVGYVYTKFNKGYSENYLYLGRRKCSIWSSYGMNSDTRRAHLYMFCNPSNFDKGVSASQRESMLIHELSSRLRSGYDGNFSINFSRKDLKEKCFGCKVDVDPDAVWVLSENGYIILPNNRLYRFD